MHSTPTRVVLLYLDEHLVVAIALDNWSVHINERVPAALQARQSKIQLLFQRLRTLDEPDEKVWLRFNEDVSHMHPHGPSGSALTTG